MSTAESLAERILPARGAAQKASASFAEQLTDPDDADSPSPPHPFGEPSHRAKAVKYRYTATGKHLSSPLKSSPERKQPKQKRSKLATFTPAPPSHAHKDTVPAVATTSRKRKASPSFRKEDAPPSGFSSPLSSAPTSPTVSTRDLPPSPTLAVKGPAPGRAKRLSFSKAFSLHSLEPTSSKLSVFSQPLSPKRKQKNKTNTGKDAWDIGNSVWVLVNQSGVLADSAAKPQSESEASEQLMWWPAQVVQILPLRVSLFGDFPSASSSSRGLCTIFTPSSANVQSINDDSGAKRFSRATFCVTSLAADPDRSPPAKKARLDESASFEANWESAVQSMEKASTLEKDGLPALLSTYATTGDGFYDSLDDSDADISDLRQAVRQPAGSARKKSKPTDSTRKLKPQRSKANLKGGTNGSAARAFSPCPPDPTLQIPGELILAMAPRTGGSYWPAKILEHIPDRKEKYKVKFLDDEVYDITRDRFWTSEEDGFVQCTLGEWESAVKTIDDPESGDEDGEFGMDDSTNDLDDATTLPPPPPAEEFEDLSVRAQLAYVKPVLRAILTKEYGPARERHDAFMKGGSGRAELLKSAGVRGGMDARFVNAVQKAICKWVLGDGGVKPDKLDVGETVPSATEVGDTAKVDPPQSPCDPIKDAKMEGIESQGDVTNEKDGAVNGATPPPLPDKQIEEAQDSQMVVDGQEQQPVSPPAPVESVALSPVLKQASLAPKSQLDLLAEVSQAVATEPSLLPSHPEPPKLKVDLLDAPRKDTSSLPTPLTPVPDEDQQLPPQSIAPVVCEEFDTLSGVEKLDYCLNILLPETIQQLLLWRSGQRTVAALQSPEEEQRLHDVGARKAAETDWVDDVMRLRAAQARIWGVDPSKRLVEEMQGGTRSRPRRGTVSTPRS